MFFHNILILSIAGSKTSTNISPTLKHKMVLFTAVSMVWVRKDRFNGRLVGNVDVDAHTPMIRNANRN